MKLKGITKLVLAGTALAATAATLTTSTYAWYVTNSTVSATGVSGQVDSTSAGSLYIAKNLVDTNVNKPDNFGPSITLELANKDSNGAWKDEDLAAGKFTADKMNPQSYYKEGVYVQDTEVTANNFSTKKTSLYTLSGSNYTAVAEAATFDSRTKYYKLGAENKWLDTYGNEITGGPSFIEFKYWLTSDKGGDIDFTLMVDNITDAAIPQKALTATGLPTTDGTTKVAKGASFTVDAVYALRMSITKAYQDDTYEQVNVSSGSPKDLGLYTESAGSYTLTADTEVQSGTKYYKKYTAGVAQDLATLKVAEVAKNMDGTDYDTSKTTAVATNHIEFAKADGDANGYFVSAMNGFVPYNYDATNTDSKEKVETGETSFSSVHLEAEKNMLLTFRVWLEGSDSDCFDSCKGQKFDFAFKFQAA